MVKVIKKNKSMQDYKESKVVKACIGSKIPEPIAKTIGRMITAELKGKDSIKSSEIKAKVLAICKKVGAAPKNWVSYKKK